MADSSLAPGTAWKRLLAFWFGELDDGFADDAHRTRWFKPDAAFDEACKLRFGELLQPAADGLLEPWLDAPVSALAYVILCDQLPRNIHRGTRLAFAWDARALAASRLAVERGYDLELGWDERGFLYMPFEHSEAILDQHTAVGLFTALRDAAPRDRREVTGNQLRFAQKHRDIVLRFGRFPHRNAVLGRASTPAEEAFIAAGDGFGQAPGG